MSDRPPFRAFVHAASDPDLPAYTKGFSCKIKDDIWREVTLALQRWEADPKNRKKHYFDTLANESDAAE
jgi:hypothetical protein